MALKPPMVRKVLKPSKAWGLVRHVGHGVTHGNKAREHVKHVGHANTKTRGTQFSTLKPNVSTLKPTAF